jgi:hypothetical protein
MGARSTGSVFEDELQLVTLSLFVRNNIKPGQPHQSVKYQRHALSFGTCTCTHSRHVTGEGRKLSEWLVSPAMSSLAGSERLVQTTALKSVEQRHRVAAATISLQPVEFERRARPLLPAKQLNKHNPLASNPGSHPNTVQAVRQQRVTRSHSVSDGTKSPFERREGKRKQDRKTGEQNVDGKLT